MKKFATYLIITLFLIGYISIKAEGIYASETSYIKSTKTYKTIKAAIEKIKIIDSHEHLRPERYYQGRGARSEQTRIPDFFDIAGYWSVESDISNIGNTFSHDERYLNKSLSTEERWNSFLPIYSRLKNTGFMKSVRIGIKKVHNIEITDAASIEKINESLKKAYKPGMYKRILQDIGNIDCVLIYGIFERGFPKEDFPDFFRGVRYIDPAIIFTMPEQIYEFEERYGINVHNLENLEQIYRKFVEESIKGDVVGFKSAAAYLRSLDFSRVNRIKAEDTLKKLLQFTKVYYKRGNALTVSEGTELTNYCMHMMLSIIEVRGFPISFHTGYTAFGKNDIRRTNPHHLIPLFKEYKNLNFNLLHGGFPYVMEFLELGKDWPNVFLDLAVNHILSPEGTRTLLSELLECVPINKIFAFGGDEVYPELVIGHLEMAKENCAIVLADKVLNGYFTLDEAIEYAHRIFRKNLIEFFKLDLPD